MASRGYGGGELRRELGLLDAVAVGLGAIVGAGIFVVLGVVAGVAGPALVLSIVLAGVVATLNALSSAELAATFPRSGGTYEYGYELLNPWAGYAAGWLFIASKLAAGGTVALGLGQYVANIFPGALPQGVSAAVIVILTIANLMGVRKVGILNITIVAVTLSALTYFAVSGLLRFDAAKLSPFFNGDPRSVLQGAGLIFFAFTGYARIATLAEEVKEPSVTIPRSIKITLGVSVGLYLAVALSALGSVGPEALSSSSAPLFLAATEISVPGLEIAVGIAAMFAMLGVLLSQIFGISRVVLAMSRRGDLPSALGVISASRSTPDLAIIFTSLVIFVLSIFGTIEFVISAATFTILFYYAITNIAALKLQRSTKLFPRWVGIFGLLSCLLLAFSLSITTILSGFLLLGVGIALRLVNRKLTGFCA
jgi:APA family basic amino acid/polyamine antiporter